MTSWTAAAEPPSATRRWTEADTRLSIHKLFERQVRAQPGHPAISGPDGTITYGEVDRLACGYQELLLARAARDIAGRRVALLLDQGAAIVAGVLAATRCGAVAVCLSPTDPASRLGLIRESVEPVGLLLDAGGVELAHSAGFRERDHVVVPAESNGFPSEPPAAREVGADDLAYLVCTSGTTAMPKIVLQTHRTVAHNVLRYTNGLGLCPTDRVGWFAAPSGGQGMATMWSTLLNGATLCPFPIAARGIAGIDRWVAEYEVTVLDALPSVLRNVSRSLGDRRLPGVRLVRLASEPALVSDLAACRRHLDDEAIVAHVLASSEAGIMAQALFRSGDAVSGERLPVTQAAEGIELSVVDDAGAPARDGETGEIVVRGAYLSPGYWRDDAQTASRFESEPGGIRAFHTRDLARRSDGSLTLVGRADAQVKIRGYQVQLDQVEAAVAGLPGVSGAAVVVRHGARGDPRLTAYVVPRPGCTVEVRRLRHDLRAYLPSYAIPVAWSILDALPLNANGKVDRSRLAEVPPPVADGSVAQAPLTATEELLRDVWQDALDREGISVEDTFLDVGGDSLSAAVLAAAAEELFGHELDLGYFAGNPSLKAMAEELDRAPAAARAADDRLIRRAAAAGRSPLSFAQESMWRQAPLKGAGFNLAVPYRIVGKLDVGALERALGLVVRRHDILRTTFVDDGTEPTAVVQPPTDFDLRRIDLSREADPEARAAGILAEEAHRPFSLAGSPPLRLRLLDLPDEEHRLLVVAHHLICDAPSWKIFVAELAAFYEAILRDGTPPVAEAPELQFGDYAAWERRAVRPGAPAAARDVAWWRQALEGAPRAAAASFAAPAPGVEGEAGVLDRDVPAQLSASLDSLGRSVGATFFMTRLALFGAGLSLLQGADDLLVGTYLTSRRRTELLNMIGPLINRATLRLRLGPQASFRDWLLGVRRTVIGASAHGGLPYELLWQELGPAIPQPRVRVKFEALDQPPPRRFGGLEMEPLARQYVEPWAFTLVVAHGAHGDRWRLVFDQEHDPDRVERFLARLEALALAGSERPDVPIARLPLVDF